MSYPVAALSGLGVVIAALGLFAAGDLKVVIVGLVSVAVAAAVHAVESRNR
jgi:uncharacterized membrane protein